MVYRTDRLQPRQLFGELDYNPNGTVVNGKYVVPPKTQKFKVEGEDIETLFYGFNRNPFMSTWRVLGDSTITFMLVTAHLFFGKKHPKDPRFRNRVAEAFFLAQWASSQRRKGSNKVYESNIILLGDMNVPKMEKSDPVFAALLRRGMLATKYSTEAGTTIKEFNSYDQVVFTKETSNIVKIVNQRAVVVDFDNFVFPTLWQQVEAGTRTKTDFKRWTKFAVSDHRPVLVRLKV